ncbi:MAG: nicotinate (nicotinamide) nucleotide adenylyltransferase [Deltaproteobacteria bacterium]|jgi:nicotinate-nucleotide adenylyltransferase|nr:nicotinate (nicotinamide) nucleotide adenylyltransferase [Deltaproteobacteria bacterium]
MIATQARIGILGGTFNPIHIAHLRAAEEVIAALDLERVIFVPSADPPHKVDVPGDRIASAQLRLEWIRLAIRDNPRFEVDTLEIERGGSSYSVDTLRTIGERIAPEKPVFTIGQDAFVEIDSWREPEALFALAHFAVITRPPLALASLTDWLPRCIRDAVETDPGGFTARHREADTWIRRIDIPALEISSSDIRTRLRDDRSVRYLLPAAVEEAIEKSGAYRDVEGARRT